jgi:hypothetical protein
VKDLSNDNYKTVKKEIEEDGQPSYAYGLAELIL